MGEVGETVKSNTKDAKVEKDTKVFWWALFVCCV
jgi:hypothetical protein